MTSYRERKRGGSLSHEIRFYIDRQSRTIVLGKKYTEKTARTVDAVVETLLRYKANGMAVPDKRTTVWIEKAPPEIRKKLVKAGLIEVPPSHTLKELWDIFLKTKSKMKAATISSYEQVKDRFFTFFKENESLEKLTKERLLSWRESLSTELAPASVATCIKQTKTCLTWAKNQGWIEKSPLDKIGRGSFRNKSNDRIIPMAEYYKLLDACPCQDWRAIIALARIGGLRAPSEVIALRWEDVNWEKNCFYVRSSKTEHHEGKESRIVPIFPELKKELEALFFSPKSEGKEFVINRYRSPKQNLGTTFGKIVTRAGLSEIPRPFDNMRMTRSNEVYRRWGAYFEKEWIGHSNQVCQDSYLMIQDGDYEAASAWSVSTNAKQILPHNFPHVGACNGLHSVAVSKEQIGV